MVAEFKFTTEITDEEYNYDQLVDFLRYYLTQQVEGAALALAGRLPKLDNQQGEHYFANFQEHQDRLEALKVLRGKDRDALISTLASQFDLEEKLIYECLLKRAKELAEQLDLHRLKTHREKLSISEVATIKFLLKKGHSGAELSRRFNVSDSLISDIKLGRHWKGVGEDIPQVAVIGRDTGNHQKPKCKLKSGAVAQANPRHDVLDLLRDFSEGLKPQEIAWWLNKNEAAVRQLLKSMKSEGQLHQDKWRGCYKVVEPIEPETMQAEAGEKLTVNIDSDREESTVSLSKLDSDLLSILRGQIGLGELGIELDY